MSRLLPLGLAVLIAFSWLSVANAICTDSTIGADIIIYGMHVDNKDFDDDSSDAMGKWTEKVKIHLINTYSDKIKTVIRFDAKTYDSSKPSLEVNRAYIEMQEFLHEDVTLKVGKLSWSWQMRRSFGSTAYYDLVYGDLEATFLMDIKPLGWDVKYKLNADISLAAGWGKAKEASVAGNNDNDIDIIFIRYDQKLSEANKFFVALLFFIDRYEPTAGTWTMTGDIWYLNAGIDYFLMEEELELYLEFAYQGGDPHNPLMDFGAMAVNVGLEYTFQDVSNIPYVCIDITWLQGEDGNTYGFQRYYSNWNRTLIAESQALGGVWNRPGYLAFKLMVGMKSISSDKYGVDFILGWFKADGDLPIGTGNGLGWEFDIIGAYYYNEDVAFTAGLGYFSADEDLGGIDPDSTIMLLWGMHIFF